MSGLLSDLLRQRLERLGGGEMVVGPARQLTVEAALARAPAPDLGAAARCLVSLDETAALVELLAALDGQVAALLLVSPAEPPETVRMLADIAGCDVLVSDRGDLPGARTPAAALGPGPRRAPVATQWLMTTSGTTGRPKIVPQALAALVRTVRPDPQARRPVWGLVYEPSRFAGLQVVLQAVLGGGVLVAPDRHRPLAEQVGFLVRHGVTHLSATPTLWRRLLMAGGALGLPLRQVTLGGEIVDQKVLDVLAAQFPDARITHIYASTEAGVGFAVNDRRAGFPAAYLADAPGGVALKLKDGVLWVRPPPPRTASYLSGETLAVDDDGYLCTGDRIEAAGERLMFLGRDGGSVNVGGVKVYPEQVERTILGVPGVALARIEAKSSPITGALLVATIVPERPDADPGALSAQVLAACRADLPREAVPAKVRLAAALGTNAAGKLVRS